MTVDWRSFHANGGYSNENSDPASYDDGYLDNDDEYEDMTDECIDNCMY